MLRASSLILIAFVLAMPAMAFADPPEVDELSDLQPEYIGISGTGTGPVWVDNGVTIILTAGEEDFAITVSETYPGDIDTCWVYFNGDVSTGTSPEYNIDTYRIHYGCVAIEYDDDYIEYAAFEVTPYWPAQTQVTLNASPPVPSSWCTMPEDVESVFYDVNDIEPGGPSTTDYEVKLCVRRGVENPLCDAVTSERTPECTTNEDCRNYP